jgi:hypothetical protein
VWLTITPEYPSGVNLPPWLAIGTPEPGKCRDDTQTAYVQIAPHAPPGPVTLHISGRLAWAGTVCNNETVTVTVNRTYDLVVLEYNTFIAPQVVFIGELLPSPLDPFHRGDNRWFGDVPAYSRSHQTIGVSFDPVFSGGPVTGEFGPSETYSDDPFQSDAWECGEFCSNDFNNYDDWCLQPFATADCTGTAVHGMNGNILQAQRWRGTDPTLLFVNISETGKNPCVTITNPPAIDVNLNLEFRQICDGTTLKPMEFRVFDGRHDGFPWHEFFMTRIGGPKVPVYVHDPCCTHEEI